ncbi:hypothetical protein ELAC_1657 [Estrella lausannensis]|uniref:Uncharacterized protein n=1 Tax=Estrella lausannensis TaxID=483423 RepID=A0A0H5DT45_9BACT|nr:hypothetical protein ELAC_1657 [Estrella lausannensis]
MNFEILLVYSLLRVFVNLPVAPWPEMLSLQPVSYFGKKKAASRAAFEPELPYSLTERRNSMLLFVFFNLLSTRFIASPGAKSARAERSR